MLWSVGNLSTAAVACFNSIHHYCLSVFLSAVLPPFDVSVSASVCVVCQFLSVCLLYFSVSVVAQCMAFHSMERFCVSVCVPEDSLPPSHSLTDKMPFCLVVLKQTTHRHGD